MSAAVESQKHTWEWNVTTDVLSGVVSLRSEKASLNILHFP